MNNRNCCNQDYQVVYPCNENINFQNCGNQLPYCNVNNCNQPKPCCPITIISPTGATGPTGPQGDVGPTGADGVTPLISIGTVTTGAPGTEASVTITGEPPAYVFNFVIPQGPTGPAA